MLWEQLTLRLLPPYEGEDSNAMSQFLASVTDLFEYALRNCNDSDMAGIKLVTKLMCRTKYRYQLQKKGPDKLKCDMVSFRESGAVEC